MTMYEHIRYIVVSVIKWTLILAVVMAWGLVRVLGMVVVAMLSKGQAMDRYVR